MALTFSLDKNCVWTVSRLVTQSNLREMNGFESVIIEIGNYYLLLACNLE